MLNLTFARYYRRVALVLLLALPSLVCLAQDAGLSASESVSQPRAATQAYRSTGVRVSLSPATATIGIGADMQFSATVSGSANHGVTWTVNGVSDGNATYGTVDPSTQLYFAPVSVPSPATVTIKATSVANPLKSASATVTVLSSDPVGAVNDIKQISCPSSGVTGATCEQMQVSCEGVNNWTTYVKINQPTGASKGTVMFGIGTGGSGLYDNDFTYGTNAVQDVLNAGFTTVQVSFGSPFTSSQPNGWLTGPGGVRRLACRYAAVAQWVYDKVQNDTSKPMCATGNSGGSSAVSYAIAHYAEDSIFSMVELTSGPPMSRIDYGCLCNQGTLDTTCGQGQLSLCYGTGNAAIIDPAYNQPICSNAVNGHPQPIDSVLFLADSINAPGATLSYPKTYVNVVYGGQDNSSAVPLGLEFYNAVTSTKAQSCVADAPHTLPDVLDGATQVANDLIALCKLQP
jgi:hypothetical protein